MSTVLALALLLLAPAAHAAKTSFDCAKAKDKVELLVCRDETLAKLDLRAAELFRMAEANAAGERARIALRDAQRAWPPKRSACARSAEMRACTMLAYRKRISELQVQSGEAVAPMATLYDCGKLGTATVRYYPGTELPVAVVSFGIGDTDTAVATSPEPGARYVGARYALRNDGSEALVSRRGHPDTACRRKA